MPIGITRARREATELDTERQLRLEQQRQDRAIAAEQAKVAGNLGALELHGQQQAAMQQMAAQPASQLEQAGQQGAKQPPKTLPSMLQSPITRAVNQKKIIELAKREFPDFDVQRASIGPSGAIFLQDSSGQDFVVPEDMAPIWLHEIAGGVSSKPKTWRDVQAEKNFDLKVKEFEAKQKKDAEYLQLAKDKAGSAFSIENREKYKMVLGERNKAFERWKALAKAASNDEVSQDEADAAYEAYQKIDAMTEEMKKTMSLPAVEAPVGVQEEPEESGWLAKFGKRLMKGIARRWSEPWSQPEGSAPAAPTGTPAPAAVKAPVNVAKEVFSKEQLRAQYMNSMGQLAQSGYMQGTGLGGQFEQAAKSLNDSWQRATGRPVEESPHYLTAVTKAEKILRAPKGTVPLPDQEWANAMKKRESERQKVIVQKATQRVATREDFARAVSSVGRDPAAIKKFLQGEGIVVEE